MLLPYCRRLELLSLIAFISFMILVTNTSFSPVSSKAGSDSQFWQHRQNEEEALQLYEQLSSLQDLGPSDRIETLQDVDNGIAHTRYGRPRPSDSPTQALQVSREQKEEVVRELMAWNRPRWSYGHWPPYEEYFDKDYDPNRWEAFEEEDGYYANNGATLLEHSEGIRKGAYVPYPEYNTPKWREQWKGEYVTCNGPRGKPFNESSVDHMQAYDALPSGFPKPFVGSSTAIGLQEYVCIDRDAKYGPYGYGQFGDRVASWRRGTHYVEWEKVSWGALQTDCLKKNLDRYAPVARTLPNVRPGVTLRTQSPERPDRPTRKFIDTSKRDTVQEDKRNYQSRTAVLYRVWEGYSYTENDLQAIRSMITELSLLSGGEYQVFLFVNVKDSSVPIMSDERAYDAMLRKIVPKEFWDIAVLWNEDVCKSWYGKVGDWQVYWQQWMSLQWFSSMHPEFDYVWNWEVDARYIGNHYHFLSQIGDFAAKQPRKYLWERNARYYIPSVHGSDFDAYARATNDIIEQAAATNQIDPPVWGPRPYSPAQFTLGPSPPRHQREDRFEWGVDEPADLITLLPMWDPVNTTWSYRNKIWNYIPGYAPRFSADNPTDPDFDHPDFMKLPRRVFINTVVRLSKRLLEAMHTENVVGRAMQAEMFPATVALHHGFKAVYAPQPIWADRKWPGIYADAVFNADGGVDARWGQNNDTVYNHDREHNFNGWSWYYRSNFARKLYRRWLGWDESSEGWIGGRGERGRGPMCLPPMLLHPIKNEDVRESGGR